MKILLIPVPCRKNMLPIVPIGLLYISEYLRNHECDCEILDLNFSRDKRSALEKKLQIYRPHMIGVSIRNIAESMSMNYIYEEIKQLVEACREFAPVVLGGAGFSIFPDELMNLTEADYGIVGPGEGAMAYLIENLQFIPRHTILSRPYDGFPESNISDEYERYWSKYGQYYKVSSSSALPVQVTRGCRFRCAYCSYPIINPETSFRPHSKVIDEIQSIYNLTGHNSFYFVDSIFNMNKEYTKGFLHDLINRNLHLHWSCCLSPYNYDQELLEMMKTAGCIFCEVGVDSFADAMLQQLHKPYNAKMAYDMLCCIQEIGIPCSISLIIGGHGETLDTLQQTLKIANSLKLERIFAFIGERVYPHTALAAALQMGPKQVFLAGEDSIYISSQVKEALEEFRVNAPKNWAFNGYGV